MISPLLIRPLAPPLKFTWAPTEHILAGDLDLEGAATHELHFRSRYSINPLVLSLDQKGGGPNAQREIVRTRLQRTFAPMGSLQKVSRGAGAQR